MGAGGLFSVVVGPVWGRWTVSSLTAAVWGALTIRIAHLLLSVKHFLIRKVSLAFCQLFGKTSLNLQKIVFDMSTMRNAMYNE